MTFSICDFFGTSVLFKIHSIRVLCTVTVTSVFCLAGRFHALTSPATNDDALSGSKAGFSESVFHSQCFLLLIRSHTVKSCPIGFRPSFPPSRMGICPADRVSFFPLEILPSIPSSVFVFTVRPSVGFLLASQLYHKTTQKTENKKPKVAGNQRSCGFPTFSRRFPSSHIL